MTQFLDHVKIKLTKIVKGEGMNTKNNIKKSVLRILVFTLLLTSFILPSDKIQGATKYIKVGEFIKELLVGMELEVKEASINSCIDKAMEIGLINKDTFSDYNNYINRMDAAVLLNKADEYIYGKTLEDELLNIVLSKRISDIKKIDKSKREAVASIVAKGIIKGYSNGYYIQNREFRGKNLLTRTGASEVINLLMTPSKRSSLSKDGMLIRTTNLPRNAEHYDYILACYPNEFYEMKFEFMWWSDYLDGTMEDNRHSFPMDMKNEYWYTWSKKWPFIEESNKYLSTWTERVEDYLNLVFNVDYRTVNDTWIKDLASCYAIPIMDNLLIGTEKGIQKYIDDIKENKVVVESKIIAVESSTLYEYDGVYYLRAYVKYRIKAIDTDVEHDRLLYSHKVHLNSLKNGEWREGIFDIELDNGKNMLATGNELYIQVYTELNDRNNIKVY